MYFNAAFGSISKMCAASGVQIVQVCTSSTFPITTCDFITAGVRYFQDDPVLKARVLAGKHRDMVWMSDAKYKRACFWRNIRVALLTSMMKRTGKSRLGDKVCQQEFPCMAAHQFCFDSVTHKYKHKNTSTSTSLASASWISAQKGTANSEL